jgi:GTP pyrophosphokinase
MIKEIVVKAYDFAKKAHEGQYRKFSSLLYFTHPKAVARIIEQLTGDEDMVAAALLHDTVEDCGITIETIQTEFNEKIATLVNELTNKKEEERGNRNKREYLYEKIRNLSDDALTIKLADRLHNVMFLEKDAKDIEQQKFIKYYYEETRFILRGNFIWRNEIQRVLVNRIESILDFIKIRYKY